MTPDPCGASCEPAEDATAEAAVTVRCSCPEPDWYHDGIPSYVDGRLCRRCRLREGYNPEQDRYDRVCQDTLTMSGTPDTLIGMDTYTDTLTSAVITAAETTHPGVWSKAPKRKPLAPHGRAQRIRALTDLITVAQGLLEAEMRDGRDFTKTAPDLSYTLMGQAAGMTRQAAHEAVTRAVTAPRTGLRRKPLGHLALGSALLNTDEEQS